MEDQAQLRTQEKRVTRAIGEKTPMHEPFKNRFSRSFSLVVNKFVNPESAIILVCIACIIGVYWHDSNVLIDDALRNEMASYILALPLLLIYMIYKKRNLIKAQLYFETQKPENVILKDIVATSLCLSALFLYVYGSFSFDIIQYHLISIIVFAIGCATFLLGVKNLKNIVFPMAFLLLLIVPYREEAYQVGGQLSTLTSAITFNLLNLLKYPVSLSSLYESPSITIKTTSGQEVPFVIDIPCAGAYSLIGFLVFALFFAYVSRGSILKKALWLIIGFALIYGANIARVSMILVIGYWFGVETAMSLFHLLSGSVLIFVASFFMIIVGEKFLKVEVFTERTSKEISCPKCEKKSARNETFCNYCGKFFYPINISLSKMDLGKIFALGLFVAVLINIQVPALALTDQNAMELDIHALAGQTETLKFLPETQGYEPQFIYRDLGFEKFAQQDASLLYYYRAQNSSHTPIFVSIEVGDSFSKLHRWEICLYIVPSEQGGQIVKPIVSKDIQIIKSSSFTGRLFVFQYINTKQTVMILYWYEKLAFKIGDNWESRYVKTSLLAFLDTFVSTGEIKSVDDYTLLEENMTLMAQDIINHWEPVKQWSALTVAFAGWGQILAIFSIMASTGFITILQFKNTRDVEKKAQSSFKQLLWHTTFSKEEKEIQKVLETLKQKERMTLLELADVYKQETNRTINPEKLIEIINHVEEYNLVKKEIINENDKPVIMWRTMIPQSTNEVNAL
jgi:exosortase